jgi:hypothetical protein
MIARTNKIDEQKLYGQNSLKFNYLINFVK